MKELVSVEDLRDTIMSVHEYHQVVEEYKDRKTDLVIKRTLKQKIENANRIMVMAALKLKEFNIIRFLGVDSFEYKNDQTHKIHPINGRLDALYSDLDQIDFKSIDSLLAAGDIEFLRRLVYHSIEDLLEEVEKRVYKKKESESFSEDPESDKMLKDLINDGFIDEKIYMHFFSEKDLDELDFGG